jgi:protoporphyrinogen oxidase
MSMKDWIRRAYGEDFVTVLIDTIVMGGIYFYVIG